LADATARAIGLDEQLRSSSFQPAQRAAPMYANGRLLAQEHAEGRLYAADGRRSPRAALRKELCSDDLLVPGGLKEKGAGLQVCKPLCQEGGCGFFPHRRQRVPEPGRRGLGKVRGRH
jgi:hypothetical protein